MDAAKYKHVVLGLTFHKYISDLPTADKQAGALEAQHARLEAVRAKGANPEDPDEYRAANAFWVPPEARWAHFMAQARQPTIGQIVDNAWPTSSASAIERTGGKASSAAERRLERPPVAWPPRLLQRGRASTASPSGPVPGPGRPRDPFRAFRRRPFGAPARCP